MGYKPKPISKFIPFGYIPEKIHEAIKSFEGRWLPKHEYSGDLILFHYTKPEGLMGIIKSRSFWGTDTKYLSDPLELQYGRKLIFNKVNKYYDREQDVTIKRIFKRLNEFDNARENLYPSVYIACLSEKDDVLKQWNEYAAKGFGYNLGILFKSELPETKYSRNIELLKPNRSIDLRKVIYNPDEQINIIEDLLSTIVSSIRDLLKNGKVEIDFPEKISMGIYNFFIELMITMKSPSFEDEQEWRLIDMPFKDDNPSELINYRIANDIHMPYHNTYLYEERNGRLEFPLQSIRLGPMLDEVKTKKSLEIFLNSMNAQSHKIALNTERIKISKTDSKI